MMVKDSRWKEQILEAYEDGGMIGLYNPERNNFLQTIWEMSMTAFDSPREIQVVLDSNNNIFADFGSASFVEFKNESKLSGMKLPIKCWIHTHPFGKAYFSGTDMSTIRSWKPLMLTAIVLGDNEHQVWMRSRPNMVHYTYSRIKEFPSGVYEE